MEEANYEDSLVMTDAQGENVSRQRGKAGSQQPLFMHIQFNPTALYSTFS